MNGGGSIAASKESGGVEGEYQRLCRVSAYAEGYPVACCRSVIQPYLLTRGLIWRRYLLLQWTPSLLVHSASSGDATRDQASTSKHTQIAPERPWYVHYGQACVLSHVYHRRDTNLYDGADTALQSLICGKGCATSHVNLVLHLMVLMPSDVH